VWFILTAPTTSGTFTRSSAAAPSPPPNPHTSPHYGTELDCNLCHRQHAKSENYCAQCHASDARGARGFPNLADGDWLWGGDPKAIEETIQNGRTAVMPPQGATLGPEGVKDVAHYVMSLSGMASDSIRVARGKEKFAQICAACHGPDGKGNPALGAPNLTDKVWLYGGAEADIIATIQNGRTGQMPAWKGFLGEAKSHVLAAYVWGLSNKRAK
jgi:cytochrome c oxidase cbb3-type subunit 3